MSSGQSNSGLFRLSDESRSILIKKNYRIKRDFGNLKNSKAFESMQQIDEEF